MPPAAYQSAPTGQMNKVRPRDGELSCQGLQNQQMNGTGEWGRAPGPMVGGMGGRRGTSYLMAMEGARKGLWKPRNRGLWEEGGPVGLCVMVPGGGTEAMKGEPKPTPNSYGGHDLE